MSVKAQTWVWDHSDTKGNDLIVLLKLADWADDFGLGARPSIKTLARKTRLHERTVQRTIDRLVQHGRLMVCLNGGPNGENSYRVLIGGRRSSSAREMGALRGGTSATPPGGTSATPVHKYVHERYVRTYQFPQPVRTCERDRGVFWSRDAFRTYSSGTGPERLGAVSTHTALRIARPLHRDDCQRLESSGGGNYARSAWLRRLKIKQNRPYSRVRAVVKG